MSLVSVTDQNTGAGVFVAPLSFAQQRLWFLSQLHPENCAYNVPFGLRLTGELDRTALQNALAFLVHRHESLRTTFKAIEGVPHQVVAPGAVVSLEVAEACSDDSIERLRETEATTPFQLETGPLIRFRLLARSSTEHILLITLHHIISDGWSAGVIVREIIDLYGQFLNGEAPKIAELPIQYADYASWQHEYFTGEVVQKELEHWKQVLKGAPQLLELPTEFPRPKELSFEGADERHALEAPFVERVQEFCRQQRVTPFMFYTAAFKAVLARYTGQTDLVLGTPVANRDRVELENLVGFVANTVLLRTTFSQQDTFLDLLSKVRSNTVDALAHQHLPYDKLVEELQPERTTSHNPLFQVLVGVYDNPSGTEEVGGLKAEVLDPFTRTSKFDLSLYVVEGAAPLLKLEYRSALFSRAYAQRFLGHLVQFCSAAINSPNVALNSLPLITASETQQILQDWNATSSPLPETTLHALIEEQAARTPNATALVFEGRPLTYAELNARSNQVAHLLRASGVGRDTFVGICMERSFEMVIALLGVLKAGGAYVPIDPGYPAERVQFMLQDAAAPVLLTQSRLLAKLTDYKGKLVPLDGSVELASYPSNQPEPLNSPDDLAYCIYTSGSTGKPKGAINTHRGICNRLLWGQRSYPITPRDKVLQKTPFSFDVSVWEFFWPLVTGATLVIARPEGHKDPGYLVDIINRERITTIHFVPSMLQAFLNEPSAATCKTLTKTICSGEALSIELQQQFFSMLDCRLLNFYGPTEASVECSYWECDRKSNLNFVPIGKPIANTQLYILNEAMQPVPTLVPGELYIGGIGVARGYHDRPELTAEKFVADPFRKGNRLYRTGDLARFLPDGNIQYLGRIDHQVKIRGFRIELEEIESVLRQHPLIKDSVVIAREIKGQQHLIGYFVAYPSVTVETESLRAFLRSHLPEFMVPAFFIALREIPLSPSGKVDRRALPDPELDAKRAQTEFVPPRNPTEEKLAQIWCEVLCVDQAGVHDNFFDLGGHSLLATKLVSRIKMNLDTHVPLARIFECPTIAELSGEIQRSRGVGNGPQRRSEKIALPDSIGELSASEIDALLQKELG